MFLFPAIAVLLGACFLRAADLPVASAESMDGLMSAWTRGFSELHPDMRARITLRAKFSADFADPLGRGEVKVAPFPRELFAGERDRIAELAGSEPLLIPVATGSRATKGGTHAIVIFVNQRNPLARLTMAQLRDIFSQGGHAATWGDLGLTGEWSARRITVHGMKVRRETGNPPGVVNFLETRLLAGRGWRADLREYVDGAESGQALEQIVRGVASDEGAIGYSGDAYAMPGVKPVALGESADGPFVEATEQAVASRAYPLTRTLYLLTRANPDAATRAFVAYALSPAGQQAIGADRQGFHPLPVPAASRLEPRAGAGYLNADGSIAVVGYNDMTEMVTALCAGFAQRHPGLRFSPVLKGTRTGPPALMSDTTLVAPMGAEFSPEELAQYRARASSEPLAIRVAHASLDPRALSGPLAIVVHRDNPLASLTLPELAEIFSGRAGQTWHLHGLRADTALGLFFRRRVLGGGDFAVEFVGAGQSAEVMARVAADPAAIGFAAGMRTIPGVKCLALAPTTGVAPVPLTAETVRAGEYPLDRHLLIYLRQPVEPLAREFLRYALSPEGQAAVGQGVLGYQPLSSFERAVESARLAVAPALP